MRAMIQIALVVVIVLVGGFILNSTYVDKLIEWERKNHELTEKCNDAQSELEQLAQEKAELLKELEQKNTMLNGLESELSNQGDALEIAKTNSSKLSERLSDISAKEKQLREETTRLNAEREKLTEQIKEMQRLKAQSEERSKEYRNLLKKLHKMIDAGDLEVKIRNGLMLVILPSDVLFEVGEATLKPEAVATLVEVAKTLKTFKGRKFQIVGHSDSSPIHTEEFPSNWELSAKRAIEVVKVMVDAGLPPSMINAAGSASYDPVAKNTTPLNRNKNRRVEVIFVPKIDELPSFEEALGNK